MCRAGKFPPEAHYARGGWGAVLDRMAALAGELGVKLATGSRVDELPGQGPVIVATSLESARTAAGPRLPELERPDHLDADLGGSRPDRGGGPAGTTWRDRPAIDRGGGVYLVGDQVAAPGVLSEVSFTSAVQATRLALGM